MRRPTPPGPQLRRRLSIQLPAAACLSLACAIPGCVTGNTKKRNPTEVTAAAVDRDGRPEASNAVGPLVWGIGPAPQGKTPAAQGPGTGGAQGEKEREEARVRAQFGSSVLIANDGRVTKQYFLAGDLGPTFLKLTAEIQPDKPIAPAGQPIVAPPPGTKVGGENSRSVLGRMLGGREVEITYVADFEVLAGSAIADKPPPAPGVMGIPVVTGEQILPNPANRTNVALLLVTAMPSSLAAFENALDQFYTSIPQIEITVQVIEYLQADALSFGVNQINSTTANLANLSSSKLVQAYTSIFPLRQPVVGGNPVTDVGLFTLGGIHDSWELNAVIQALEANNLADVTSSPKLTVRNGGIAAISTTTDIPFPKAKIDQLGATVSTDIAFKPVGVKMNIIPVIAGTDSVILQVYADVSAVTNYAATEPVVTPVTSQRTAVTTVYLKNNYSLVIGGLKTVSQIESETKVPILGDIPILGFLFRSTSTTRQETSVAFQITPRIVTDRGQRVSSP